jgi:hypothetical protein
MHRVLTTADYRQTPWKNGGGRTTLLALHPPAADFARFAWRASVADVATDGPFSEFAGVDRTLVLLRGAGMRLTGGAVALDVRALRARRVRRRRRLLLRSPRRPGAGLQSDGPALGGACGRRRRARPGHRCAAGAVPAVLRGVGRLRMPPAGTAPLRLNEHETLFVDAGDGAAPTLHVNPSSAAAVALVVVIDLVGGST